MIDLKPTKYHTENPDSQKYVWYRSHRKISDYIKFESTDLINPTGKKITKKSVPLLTVGCGFDCETSRISLDSNISCVYIWQFSIGNYNFLCRDFKSIIRFVKELSSLVKNIHPNAYAIIFDANIKYEFSYFEGLFSEYITGIFAKSKTDICSFTLLNNLKFQECLGVFGTSLENLAKNYTKTKKRKGDLNYNKIRNSSTHMTRKEILYSVNDVSILSELLQVAINMYVSKGFKIPLTQTGIVRQEVKHSMLSRRGSKEQYIKSVNELIGTKDEYTTFREFLYSGGLTHSNYKYVGIKLSSDNSTAVKCKDLTSAYPWAMNVFSFPAGKLVHTDDICFALKHKHYILKLTFSNICSKSTHSTISEHKCVKLENPTLDNGRILRADTLTLWVNEIDLSNIKLIYDYDKDNCYVNDVYYFTDSKRCPQSMLNVMNEWYIGKTKLKPFTKDSYAIDIDYDNNCKEYMRLKQLINGCYGMLVTSLYFENTLYTKGKGITTETIPYEDARNTIFNPYIGYWVTSRVRERLIKLIAKYPDSIVQYDTDSLYYIPNNNIESEFNTINDDVYNQITTVCRQKELHDMGQWDDDGEYTEFCGYGSKRYCGKHADGTYKITFAGANKNDILKESKRLNIEMFDYLKDFSIDTTYSNKKGAVHPLKDFKPDYYPVTDYNGNTVSQYICGYTTIVNVQFRAHLSQQFTNLRKTFLKGVHENEY